MGEIEKSELKLTFPKRLFHRNEDGVLHLTAKCPFCSHVHWRGFPYPEEGIFVCEECGFLAKFQTGHLVNEVERKDGVIVKNDWLREPDGQ